MVAKNMKAHLNVWLLCDAAAPSKQQNHPLIHMSGAAKTYHDPKLRQMSESSGAQQKLNCKEYEILCQCGSSDILFGTKVVISFFGPIPQLCVYELALSLRTCLRNSESASLAKNTNYSYIVPL